MARWLVVAVLLAAFPVAGGEGVCTETATPVTVCQAVQSSGVPNGTETNTTNVSTLSTLAAPSTVATGDNATVAANATPYGVFVVARGQFISTVSGAGIYAAPNDAPQDWACIFYATPGGSSCQTPNELLDAIAQSTGSYQNLIINATQMVSCDVRTRACQIPLG